MDAVVAPVVQLYVKGPPGPAVKTLNVNGPTPGHMFCKAGLINATGEGDTLIVSVFGVLDPEPLVAISVIV